jgi:hypothetical protein
MVLRFSRAAILSLLTATAAACLSACGQVGVNGPVDVPAGGSAEGATTINGAVNVGEGATVGEAATVNGSVHVGANASANSVRTVNGGVDVGPGARIAHDIDAVNGGVRLGKGADVGGRVRNVNGGIRLEAAHVAKGISTFTGDIEVGHGSHVEGGIHVEKPDFGNEESRIPRVVIGAGSVVDGTLRFDREVQLLVSDTAKIGPVEGATVQLFAGDDPSQVIEPGAAAAGGTGAEEPGDMGGNKPGDKPAGGAADGAAGAAPGGAGQKP